MEHTALQASLASAARPKSRVKTQGEQEDWPVKVRSRAAGAQGSAAAGSSLPQDFLHRQPRIWPPEGPAPDGKVVPFGR
jgi:hypothetical protein